MIDSVLNLLFRCPHRRLTRPITPVPRSGDTRLGTYVVCLDCGKQFAYDPVQMRMGTGMPAGKKKFAFAVLAAVALGVVWKGRHRKAAAPQESVTARPSPTVSSNPPSR